MADHQQFLLRNRQKGWDNALLHVRLFFQKQIESQSGDRPRHRNQFKDDNERA